MQDGEVPSRRGEAPLLPLLQVPEFLLHVEIANSNRADMPLRMLRYYTDIRLAGHRGPLPQFLIYIGADALTMPVGIWRQRSRRPNVC